MVNQKPSIEEEQVIQWPKETGQKEKQLLQNIPQKT